MVDRAPRSASPAGSIRLVVVALALALLTAACVTPLDLIGGDDQAEGRIGSEALDGGDGSSGVGASADGGLDPGADPELPARLRESAFAAGACGFAPLDGLEPRCGTVVVPENWAEGTGRIELAVAVFESTNPSAESDPVIYLDGGPGSHALETIEFVVDDFLLPLLDRGDVIFFDQRGAGLTFPRLDCTETVEVTRRLEDDPSIDDDEATEAFHGALGDCRQRLLDSGIELTAYNSINNANDVEAIRLALGYERWNLFGISYGTKLGLEVLRRHPDGVRSAVLDSVYPPQVDSVLENPSTFVDSYRAVVAACGAEPACAGAGDLAERIEAVVARYEADPVRVEVRDWILDESDEVFVTGETVIELVLGALYTPSQFTDIPELITELENGRTDAIETFLSQDRTTERFFTSGMFYAIACNEEISFADRADVVAALPEDPFGLKEGFDFASNTGTLAFGTCEAFANGQAPAVSNTPVVSDVPTLLMAGAFDPVTPVSWADAAAETLSRSHLVIGPRASHGVSGGRCGMSVALAFLADPDSKPDDRCLADEPLRFLAPADDPIELEAVTFRIEDFGVEISTVRPEGWFVGSLEGDQYRQESILDPTEFYQLAGDPSLGFVLADFIGEEQGLSISDPEPFTGSVGPITADGIPRDWEHRSGRNDSVAVEWFETRIDGQATYIILVSTVEQLAANLASIVLPALEAIDVAAL